MNKQTKERSYLLDHILGLEPNQRLTEDAVDRMLEEAVQTSYQRGKQQVSLGTQGSRQTVKNKSCADKEISRENQLPYFRRPILFIMGWFFVLLKSVIPN